MPSFRFAGILFLFAYGQCLKNDDVTTLLVEEVRSLKRELAMLRNECAMKSDFSVSGTLDKRFLVQDNPSEAVAFSAFLANSVNGPSMGKLRTIIYDQIETNIGSAYDRYTGSFRAPMDGIYAFTWTIAVVGGASSAEHGEIKTELVINGQVHGNLHADTEASYDDDSATGFVIKNLTRGDDVFIRSTATHEGYAPQGILTNGNMRWTFSGWLIK